MVKIKVQSKKSISGKNDAILNNITLNIGKITFDGPESYDPNVVVDIMKKELYHLIKHDQSFIHIGSSSSTDAKKLSCTNTQPSLDSTSLGRSLAHIIHQQYKIFIE